MPATKTLTKLEYEVIEGVHGEWRVEAVDDESEGEVYQVIFSGPKAKERAEEYASLQNRRG
jgi:hypothetical protein